MFLGQVLPPLDLVEFWDELKVVSFTLHIELRSHGAGCSLKMGLSRDLGVSSQDERPLPVYSMCEAKS